MKQGAQTGKVKFYMADKGYGFITGDDGQEYFMHATGLNEKKIQAGDAVNFDLEESKKKGKGPCAVNVSLQ